MGWTDCFVAVLFCALCPPLFSRLSVCPHCLSCLHIRYYPPHYFFRDLCWIPALQADDETRRLPPASPSPFHSVSRSIRNVLETSTAVTVAAGPAAAAPPLLAGAQLSSPRPLGAAIPAAIREIVSLCDAHQSLRAARSLSMGEGGGSGGVGGGGAEAGVEAVDRLTATASTLREAVGVLRSRARSGEGGAPLLDEGEAVAVAEARRRALSAVEELAGLLSSEVRRMCLYTWYM